MHPTFHFQAPRFVSDAHGEIDGNMKTMDGMWTIVGNINRWEELCEAEQEPYSGVEK